MYINNLKFVRMVHKEIALQKAMHSDTSLAWFSEFEGEKSLLLMLFLKKISDKLKFGGAAATMPLILLYRFLYA